MNQKHYLGKRVSSLEEYDVLGPITGVSLAVDDENEYFSGTEDGYVLDVDCSYGTQEIADSILAKVSGKTYSGYRATGAQLGLDSELGDGVTVDGLYSMLAYQKLDFSSGHMSEIAAPGENAVDHEYPYTSDTEQAISRALAETKSLITKTAEEIRLEIQGVDESISATLDLIDGFTVTDDEGTVKIKGGMVTADGLTVDAANINGTLSASQVNLTGAIEFTDLDSSTQSKITTASANASNALGTANSASEQVSAWCYGSTTYIDGTQIKTGTVTATKLQGGSVSILDSSGDSAGTMTIARSNTVGIELNSSYSLRLIAGSSYNLYLSGGSATATFSDSDIKVMCSTFYPTGTAPSLGTDTNRWQSLYIWDSAVSTSDRNLKHDIESLSDKYLDMLYDLEPVRYKFNNGTSDRYHVGYISQDVEAAMTKNSIDSKEFAGFVKGTDEDGEDIYMLRYEEFIAIHTKALQNINKRLEAAGL